VQPSEPDQSKPQQRDALAAGARGQTLIGRTFELDLLTRRLDSADRDEGSVVLIAGEPGIGKTRLMAELGKIAAMRGWKVLSGRAYESEGMPAYLPFIEALSGYARDLPPEELQAQLEAAGREVGLLIPGIAGQSGHVGAVQSVSPEAERYRLFESVSTFLAGAAQSTGILLCLDDLHWADKPSLLLLQHLVRKLAASSLGSAGPARLLIVGTYRTVDLDRTHPLAEMLGSLSRERLYERVLLGSLNLTDTAGLIEATAHLSPDPGVVAAVYRETNGNPFFVEEVIRQLKADGRDLGQPATAVSEWGIPEGVRQVIGRRLARLSPDALRLLHFAAVLGTDLDLLVLERATALAGTAMTDALDGALNAGLLRDEPTCRFSHPLVREAVYDDLSLPRKQYLHLQVAEAIETVYAASLQRSITSLAAHYRLAGAAADPAKAIDYSQRAGDACCAVYAWEEAVSHYEGALQALEMGGHEDDDRRCDLLLTLGEALLAAGEGERARDVIAEEAFALAEALKDSGRAFRAAFIAQGSMERSLALDLVHGKTWIERVDRSAVAGTVDRVKADVLLGNYSRQIRGDEAKSRVYTRQAFKLAQDLGDPASITLAASPLLQGLQTPEDHDERLRVAAAIEGEAFGTIGTGAGELLLGLSFVYLTWGDRLGAERAWSRIRELEEQFHDAQVALLPLLTDALRQTLDGELEAAVETGGRVVERGLEVSKEASARQLGAAATRRALLYLGRADEALARIAKPPDLWTTGGVHYGQRALFLAHAGQRQEARELLAQFKAARDLGRPDDPTGAATLRLLLEASVVAEDEVLAAALLPRMAPLAGLLHTETYMTYCIGRLCGGAAVLLGKPDEARTYYEQALEVCKKARFRPETALTRLELGELLLRKSVTLLPPKAREQERAAAMEHIDFAIGELGAMKMQPGLERALRLRGRRRAVAESRAVYPDGLSEREVEVLRLITAGNSNQQIADALVLSLNTVLSHVTHIFAKTGAANRTEAAAYAHRKELV
jgi:DNA-binding CsgD family transcriptional regulator